MKILNEPKLSWIHEHFYGEIGGEWLNCRASLYSCKLSRHKSGYKQFESSYKEDLATTPGFRPSPLGDLNDHSVRKIFFSLGCTLSAQFPDHQLSNRKPEDFKMVPIATAIESITTHLHILAATYGESMITNIWTCLNEVIDLNECEAFSYTRRDGPFRDNTHRTTFNYFFYNNSLKRMVYFTSVGGRPRSTGNVSVYEKSRGQTEPEYSMATAEEESESSDLL